VAIALYFDRVIAASRTALPLSRESLESALDGTLVEIEIAEHSENDRIAGELLVNVASRLYPTLQLIGIGSERLELVARDINPRIELARGRRATAAVRIGGNVAPPGGLLGRADGWVARVTRGDLNVQRGPENPYAAAATAALLASELFRQVFASSVPGGVAGDVAVSLLDYSATAGLALPLPESLPIGRVAFAGVGAVGNAALWVISKDRRVSGVAHLIDPQAGELSNMQRYTLLTMRNFDRMKVAIAAKWLQDSQLEVVQHRDRFQDLVRKSHRGFETICASPDDVATRRSAQAVLPRLLVNGCTSDSGLAVSWHELDRNGACLACLYHPHGKRKGRAEILADALGLDARDVGEMLLTKRPLRPDELDVVAARVGADEALRGSWRGQSIEHIQAAVCGAANLDLSGRGRIESVPLAHQSVLAGVLMAAELVKRTNAQIAAAAQQANVVQWDDVIGPPPLHWARSRRRHPRCICADPVYRRAYAEKWGSSATAITEP
jgi:hypothetical protein